MPLSILGVSHDTTPLHVREQLALAGERLDTALGRSRNHAAECVILSTCNRFEIYTLTKGQHALLDGIFRSSTAVSKDLEPYLYSYQGTAAARHLFRVVSGIDSLILGEVQILGQVQRAWQAAHKAGVAGPVLSQFFHRAVVLGKRVHSETPISRRPASVSYAAVLLAKKILGPDLAARRVLMIGTGEVGEGVARCLHEHGLHATVVAHRQLERAHTVARRYEADFAVWEDLPIELHAADIVISSTSAPHTILQRHHVADAMQGREGRPLYLIDLAVPRDIDPGASELPGVHLHNIDDLHDVVRTTLDERRSALPAIETMIDIETAKFNEWLRARSTAPMIREIRVQADEITQSELRWAKSKLPDLTQRERQVVEAMAARITGKLLHGPIQWLKAQTLDAVEPDYTTESLDPKSLPGLFYSDAAIGNKEQLETIDSEE